MMKNKNIRIFSIIFIFMFILSSGEVAAGGFINIFIIKIGGESLTAGDEVELAKYDIILCQKFHYDDIGGDTWGAIKLINPNAEIYLYTLSHMVNRNTDTWSTVNLNNIGRYDVDRGHSMGSLNLDNPDFFLLDTSGERLYWSGDPDLLWLDFGLEDYHTYALEAIITDHVDQPWTADGVYSDQEFVIKTAINDWPAKYDTNAKWIPVMNDMVNAMTEGLSEVGQKFASNRGPSRFEEGYNGWIALDQTANPSDVVLEEAAFAVGYGTGDINFHSEPYWKRNVDILRDIKNSKIGFTSSSDLKNTSDEGIDNWGKSFTFWDALWYTMGSFHLGKNDTLNNAYFLFLKGTSTYNNLDVYYEEYDKLDLGKAVSEYQISDIGGRNIYWREFEDGYVYVNPTLQDVASIPLPEPCKQRTHENLDQDIGTLPDITEINLSSHRAAILIKAEAAECPCDLNADGSCDGRDWLRFFPDWGRTDCNEPEVEPCECDLSNDGSCDGRDWLLFFPDWGRTDCPVP